MSLVLPAPVRDLLALNLVPGIGPRLTEALLERFGSAAAVFQAAPAQLQEIPHIGAKLAADLHQAMGEVSVQAELDRMAQHGVHLLARGTIEYPDALAAIPDPPHLLYIRGTLEPSDANAVALVGSRQCTSYGKRMAERLASGLARAGITVISGLARGIDGAAHRSALQAGGRTLAVLAGGLAKIYPPEHKELAAEVAGAGALVSEAAMNMEPMAGMFPARNRIISGLARGVVIIEAAEKSGALITARHAAEQGRPVFALPGPADSLASAGAHELIRKGAILIRRAEDILEELDGLQAATQPSAPEPAPALEGVQRGIWDFLAGQARHMDEIARHLNLTISQASNALVVLELKKVVRRLPGNHYERQ